MLTNINTKIEIPEDIQQLIIDAKRRQRIPDFVFNYSKLLLNFANDEDESNWGNGLPTDEEIEMHGRFFDGFFLFYFTYLPENTQQQAKDCALELTKVMKDMAKDHKEFTYALFAYYWYSRKEV